ncbi:hypothetical protein HaLaN_00700, partial [Haematococcus lacustris]
MLGAPELFKEYLGRHQVLERLNSAIESSLVWPVAQLQRPPPALPNALHVQRCLAVPVQPPAWLWCWFGWRAQLPAQP